MPVVRLLLLVFALVFFIIAALGIPAGRFNPIGAGLACLTASMIPGLT